MNLTGIYQISSRIKPTRSYVGSAVNITKRWRVHLHHLRHGKHHSQKLQRHYDKYGESDLVFSVITGCEREQLIRIEQFYIDALKPWFNGRPTAGSQLGFKMSEESKRKSSISHKNMSSEGRRNISIAGKGKRHKPMSEETKLKLSKAHRGKRLSEEHKKKLSAAHKGKSLSEVHKRKMSLASMGNKYAAGKTHVPSLETRDKIRQSKLGCKRDPNIFKKMWETRRKKQVA
jgi:group I intron endonuclease